MVDALATDSVGLLLRRRGFASVPAYREFHHLPSLADPEADRKMIEYHIDLPRMCGLPDVQEARATVSKWPDPRITWSILASPPPYGLADWKQIVEAAWADLVAKCGIQPSYSPNNKTANITLDIKAIDRAGGTLAMSELPDGVRQAMTCRQWYDQAEAFDWQENPRSGFLDPQRIVEHELMHALGVSHGGNGLIAPIYNPRIRTVQAGYDTSELVSRYGTPKATTPVPTPGRKLIRRVLMFSDRTFEEEFI